MPNKTITAIIALTLVCLALVITNGEERFIYICIACISILGGVSIWRNSTHKL